MNKFPLALFLVILSVSSVGAQVQIEEDGINLSRIENPFIKGIDLNQELTINSTSVNDQIGITEGNSVTIQDNFVQKWVLDGSYITNQSNILTLDQDRLNSTIDDRDQFEQDTNISDDQKLSITNNSQGKNDLIKLENGSQILIDDGFETDTINPNQTLNVSNNTAGTNNRLKISGGNSITLQDDTIEAIPKWSLNGEFLTNQSNTLTLDQNKLNTTIDDRDQFEQDTNISDDQKLSIINNTDGTNDLIQLDNGSQILVNDNFEQDTVNPNQSLTITNNFNGKNDKITLSGGNSVTIEDNYEPDTNISDDQKLSVSNNSQGRNDLIQLDNGSQILVQDDFQQDTVIEKWPITGNYITNQSNTLTLDENKLNSTVDKRDQYEKDTNISDNQGLTVNNNTEGRNDLISIENGSNVVVKDDFIKDGNASSICNTGQVLTGNGCKTRYSSGDDNDTSIQNENVDSISFDTSTGQLTVSQDSASNVNTNLDGRYITSENDSSTTNEIQDPNVTSSGDQITVSLDKGGGTSSATITDSVNDSDSDPQNEIQGIDEVLNEDNTGTQELDMSSGKLVIPTGDVY